MNWHGRELPATHNVIAVFDDLPKARHAIEVLERAGIDAGDIALIGASAQQAQDRTRERKPKWSWMRIGSGVLRGAGIGLALGMLIGWISGMLFTDGEVVAALVTGAAAGMIGGGLFGAMAGLALGDAWEMSQEDVAGPVAINVGSDNLDTIKRAHEKLEHESAREVIDFDEQELHSKQEIRWVVDLIEAESASNRGPLTN